MSANTLKDGGASRRALAHFLASRCLACIVACSALLSSCATTSFNSQWKDPSWSAPQMQTMFVIATTNDVTRRRLWEDRFVAELAAHGVTATQSYTTFPDELPTPDAVRAAIVEQGYDGALCLRLVDVREQQTYVPPTRYLGPYWGYYRSMYTTIYSPGYVDITRIVTIEGTAWDARSEEGKLVWSGTTDTNDPQPGASFAADVAEVMVEALAKENVIQ